MTGRLVIMRRISLILLVISFAVFAEDIGASGRSEPSCVVLAEVAEVGSETRLLESGKEHERNYLHLKILGVGEEANCPIRIDQVFKVTDNHPGTFRKGDRIRAEVAVDSVMAPSESVGFLEWFNLTYADGSAIQSEYNGAVVDHLQGPLEPLGSCLSSE